MGEMDELRETGLRERREQEEAGKETSKQKEGNRKGKRQVTEKNEREQDGTWNGRV